MGALRWRAAGGAALLAALTVGCDARLPEPEAPGAQLYAARCAAGCHRLYAPSLLTREMWKITVTRMQGVLVRAGMPALTAGEETVMLDYLGRHSSDRRREE